MGVINKSLWYEGGDVFGTIRTQRIFRVSHPVRLFQTATCSSRFFVFFAIFIGSFIFFYALPGRSVVIDPQWVALAETAQTGATVFGILNPASGPGTVRDESYPDVIDYVNDAGAKVRKSNTTPQNNVLLAGVDHQERRITYGYEICCVR